MQSLELKQLLRVKYFQKVMGSGFDERDLAANCEEQNTDIARSDAASGDSDNKDTNDDPDEDYDQLLDDSPSACESEREDCDGDEHMNQTIDKLTYWETQRRPNWTQELLK